MTSGTEALGGHRPHLDGVRAVAVYLVVAFHAGLGALSGGFVGVDVFFVLSGFLVTSLLLRDLDGPTRRVRWRRFYSRRARRLLPAAAVNLVVTAVVFAAVAAPMELAAAERGIQAAAVYLANWYFIGQAADYFAADVEASPVLQYWSLSIEEQFYVVWPLLLAGLHALARRTGRRRVLVTRTVIAGAGLASLAAALHLSGHDVSRAYFGTDTRAYQLLAGALLATAPGLAARIRARAPGWVLTPAPVVVLVALGAMGTTALDVDPVRRGVLATAATVALLVSLEAAPSALGRRLLGWAPLAHLGRISYGTYLWHWIIVVVLARRADLSPVATFWVTAVLATALASLSHQLLEDPIRRAPALDRRPRAVVAVGLAVSLVVALVLTPRLVGDPLRSGRSEVAASAAGAEEVGASEVPSDVEIAQAYDDLYDYGSCPVGEPVACPIVTGEGAPTAIIVGESHAGMLTPMLAELARSHGVTLYGGFLPYCPWTRGLQYHQAGPDCFADQADVFDRVIPALDPDVVFLAHRPVDTGGGGDVLLRDQDAGPLRDPDERRRALERRITAVVQDLRADGRTVVMFEPIPVVAPERDPLRCLSEAEEVEECRFVTPVGPSGEEQVMRDLAEADEDVVSVDLDRAVCPYLPICDPVIDGRIVKRDDNHLTTTFTSTLVPSVDDALEPSRVLEPQ